MSSLFHEVEEQQGIDPHETITGYTSTCLPLGLSTVLHSAADLCAFAAEAMELQLKVGGMVCENCTAQVCEMLEVSISKTRQQSL